MAQPPKRTHLIEPLLETVYAAILERKLAECSYEAVNALMPEVVEQ
ncbi:MAG: hypothetical protein KGY78_11995 [Anaerolineae bacterium]|nr:hypothetical protein [Anaerolineae bacterium]